VTAELAHDHPPATLDTPPDCAEPEVAPIEVAPIAAAIVIDEAPADSHGDVDGSALDHDDVGHDGDHEGEHAEPEVLANGFAALGLSEPVLRAVAEMGYLTPTPIQEQAIPFVLMGRDVLGCAQTGTGKTASFTLPMIDILQGSRARARMPRSLILEPTRELALQVAENFVKYGKHLKLTHALIIGGESMSDQKDLLNRGVDVLIATPGRLIDMFERGGMLLTQTSVLVIDEADRMLDMGFIPDVERIVAMLPANRQTLFFSATMAPEIKRLADAFLRNPKEISVSKPASVATTITSGLALVAEIDKREALRRLIRSEDVQNALIFCNRKKDVDILFKSLAKHGFDVGALHGDMAQPVRFATLEKFKAGDLRLLCCSDVAARGIDIGGLSHVFNFDVPIHAEDYVHRIGRTGRAGKEGRTFMLATPDDRLAVEAIEKLTGAKIPPIVIDGLDVVEWSEGRGKRRGRGKPEAEKPSRGAAKAKDAAPERKERDRPAKAEPASREARKPERRPEPVVVPIMEHAPQPDIPQDLIPERGFSRPRDNERPREFDRPRDRDRDRDRDRSRFRRDDDLGPSVLGFGDETPAFMLVAARPRRAAESQPTERAIETEDHP
jgi:superfamily II DNA/RNA helicase